jgi:hypothetical protein
MAAPSSMPKNFAGAVLRLSDATTPTAVTLNAHLFKGDYTLSPINQFLNEDVYFDATTRNEGIGIGAPVRPTLSFSAGVGNLIGSSTTAPGTVLEFVHAKGAYSANISTLGANRVHTVDVRLVIEGSRWGDSADETIDCEDVRVSADFAMSGEGNTLTFNGTVTGSIVITNSTNVVTYEPFDI